MVLTTTYLNLSRDAIKNITVTEFTHGAIGTGTTPPTAGDTALETEVFRDVLDEVNTSATSSFTVSLRILTTEANGNNLTEVGYFDDPSAGDMMIRNVFTAIVKTSDFQVFLDAKVTINSTEDTT